MEDGEKAEKEPWELQNAPPPALALLCWSWDHPFSGVFNVLTLLKHSQQTAQGSFLSAAVPAQRHLLWKLVQKMQAKGTQGRSSPCPLQAVHRCSSGSQPGTCWIRSNAAFSTLCGPQGEFCGVAGPSPCPPGLAQEAGGSNRVLLWGLACAGGETIRLAGSDSFFCCCSSAVACPWSSASVAV